MERHTPDIYVYEKLLLLLTTKTSQMNHSRQGFMAINNPHPSAVPSGLHGPLIPVYCSTYTSLFGYSYMLKSIRTAKNEII